LRFWFFSFNGIFLNSKHIGGWNVHYGVSSM
jgi:hypothetical protein